uniref:Phytosulfokine n=1 Tax=Anthurium amnicola TaxID=1678845 RepID=A0A1D1YRN9_9ARAE
MWRCFRYHGRPLVTLLLVAICTARACRLLVSAEQGGASHVDPSVGMKEDAWNSMDVEDCGKGDDEECHQKRILSEAHLDYIYTASQAIVGLGGVGGGEG